MKAVDYSVLFEDNFKVARRCASEGMVLLKNDNELLPLKEGTVTAPVGRDCYNLLKGGGGSADVRSPYVKSLIDGLREIEDSGKISVCSAAVDAYNETNVYDDAVIDEIGRKSDVVLVTISRFSEEAFDRKAEKGDYYLSNEETALFDQLQKCDSVKNIIVILNLAGVTDTSWIESYSKIKSVLLCWLPGMEGGSAIADILCGNVTPSGKLTDTFAKDYFDYPSSLTFVYPYNKTEQRVEYSEDIFVGYRYFETFAPEKVIYPFGFGLSYTKFEYSNIKFESDESKIHISIDVKNVGNFSGREIVQAYVHAPLGELAKPVCELKGFAKTKLLEPNESQTLDISIDIASLASFDDTGATGFLAAYVLEKGIYDIFVASDVRNQIKAGSIYVDETYVVEQLSLKLVNSAVMRMSQDGALVPNVIGNAELDEFNELKCSTNEKIMLKDVADGKATVEDFVAQLSDDQLIELCQAQPPAFPRGTAGVGNLREFGVPNAQTADGPLGLRKTTPTTCFPCPNLMACTWDAELQYEIGKAIGFEGISTKIDILLAPALNIHRDPLCGRNFEYYSEDPLVSGNAATAVVKGVQSQGMAATVKHFAANNKENLRWLSNSLISERALREIYLKGFEIVVKQGKPWCLMTSYNMINGTYASANHNLLTGVLRGEWKYEGAIMSDWRNSVRQFEEILAGENIKMPFGYPDEIALTQEMLQRGVVTRAKLQQTAIPVIELILKTDVFKRNDFGPLHRIKSSGKTSIKAMNLTGVSATWCAAHECLDDDGGYNVAELGKDRRKMDTYIIYRIDVESAGKYELNARIATADDRCFLEYMIDGEKVAEAKFEHKSTAENPYQDWFDVATSIDLPSGEHRFDVMIRTIDEDDLNGISINRIEFSR